MVCTIYSVAILVNRRDYCQSVEIFAIGHVSVDCVDFVLVGLLVVPRGTFYRPGKGRGIHKVRAEGSISLSVSV